jgi:uncharacterized membrane protein YjjB (DUF3815 family)
LEEDAALDPWQLYLALFFSTVGFSYLIYGKKRQAWSFALAGMVLMAFGYFVDSLWLTVLIGGALTAAPFFWQD